MTDRPEGRKPSDDEIITLADRRIRELIREHGPNVPEETVMAAFREWVLPDRHLTAIRERLERWRKVSARRQARKE